MNAMTGNGTAEETKPINIALQGGGSHGGRLPQGEFRDMRMHRIDADEAFEDLVPSSKINAEWAFLEYLRDLGRTAASDWLEDNFDSVGESATLDLSGQFDDGMKPMRQPSAGRRVREFLASRTRPAAA